MEEEASKDPVDSVVPWVEAAISDDTLPAEILMRLSEAKRPPRPPLQWGLRQPRSRQILRSGILHDKEMEASRARASPTTPLSWSGGSSGSADGCEEYSRSRKRPLSAALDDGKSKMTINVGSPLRSTLRRTRKKKYAELRKEVDMLLLEKSDLKKEFEKLASNHKQLELQNQSLKKLQLSLESQLTKERTNTVSNTSHPTRVLFDLNLPAAEDEAALASDEIHGTS